MAQKKIAEFGNFATIVCTESAANTLTYKKLETGIDIMQKMAWIVSRIEYYVDCASSKYNGTDDVLLLALMTTNTRTTIATNATYTDPSVIDIMSFSRKDLGTAATGLFITMPFVKDFTALPGGGLVIPPNPLYGACQGAGLASATESVLKVYYQAIELAGDDYWALVQARRLLTA